MTMKKSANDEVCKQFKEKFDEKLHLQLDLGTADDEDCDKRSPKSRRTAWIKFKAQIQSPKCIGQLGYFHVKADE